MKIVFYASDKPREIMLAKALEIGVLGAGDEFEMRRTAEYGETDGGDDLKFPGPSPDTDVAVAFGVKGKSRQIINDHLSVGKSTLFFDKGYSRQGDGSGHTEYSRISVNGSNPLAYMSLAPRPDDRFNRLNVDVYKRRSVRTGNVLICGSSAKYSAFHQIDEPTVYAERIIRRLKKITDRHLIYRPKPSWKDATPIPGTSFSNGSSSIVEALKSCFVLVTHGSAAALDALVNGVPAIVLGGSIAKPVAETDLEKVGDPYWPDDKRRYQWLFDMAYCQWTTEELRNGRAWAELRGEIQRQKTGEPPPPITTKKKR